MVDKVYKKRKGSTMLTVVAIFAILAITCTATLSLTYSSYKLSTSESKKVENLYSAESGIDQAKKIIEVAVDTAIKSSNLEMIKRTSDINMQIQKVKTESDGTISGIKSKIDGILAGSDVDAKNVFLRNVNKPSTADNNILYYFDENLKLKLDDINAKQNDYFSRFFKTTISNELKNCINKSPDDTYTYQYLVLDNKNNLTNKKANLDSNLKVKLIYTELLTDQIADVNFKEIPITLKSTFNAASTADETPTEKTVETKYIIKVPQLNNKNIVNNSVLEKSMAVDGNMYINSGLTINGNIFNKGSDPLSNDESEFAYTKYASGIFVNVDKDEATTKGEQSSKNNITVKFNGNVVTLGTLNIKQNSDVTVEKGNIYANNVNLGKIKSTDTSISNNTLNVENDMVVDNDFTYNCKATNVTINNLYAVNQITDNSNTEDKVRQKSSSCIIVNSAMDDGKSSITIKQDAYIIGTAYINTKPRYQTGESIAIRGNYTAYTSPLNDPNNSYEFNYYEPLQLVDKIKGKSDKMSQTDKINYFFAYYDNNNNPLPLVHEGNIKLGGTYDNLYITGNYINGKALIKGAGPTFDKVNKLESKRKEFTNQVYEMGNFNKTGTGDPLKDEYYDKMREDNAKTVKKLINLSGVVEKKVYDDKNNTVVVVHKTKGKPILLSDQDSFDNTKYEDVVNINNKSGVIITDGDVELDSTSLDFKGTIITTGDLSTLPDGNTATTKTITYDGAIVQKLISDNNLQGIFGTLNSMNIQLSTIEATEDSSIKANDCLENQYWKIVK